MSPLRHQRHVAALAGATALAMALRRLGRRSGATRTEARSPLAGDALVPRPVWVSTRAITIAAPPGEVWPWIVQMGYPVFRAGWYTPYWLDRLQWGIRERSSDSIRPDLQDLRIGDRVPDSPDWSVFFTVEQADPGHALVLRSTRHLLKPMREVAFSWAFILREDGVGGTRLIMRARVDCEPRRAWLVLGGLIGLGDFLNASVMLRGVRRRSEGDSRHGARMAWQRLGRSCRAIAGATRCRRRDDTRPWPRRKRRKQEVPMAIGPVQLLVLGFNHPDFHGEVIAELDRLRESNAVRVIDSLAVYKDAEGDVEVMHLSNLSRDEAIELGSKVAALIGLGIAGEEGAEVMGEAGAEVAAEEGVHMFSDEDAWDVIGDIPNDSAAALLLIEHHWAVPLRDAIARAGGFRLADGFISPLDLIAIGLASAEEADELHALEKGPQVA